MPEHSVNWGATAVQLTHGLTIRRKDDDSVAWRVLVDSVLVCEHACEFIATNGVYGLTRFGVCSVLFRIRVEADGICMSTNQSQTHGCTHETSMSL